MHVFCTTCITRTPFPIKVCKFIRYSNFSQYVNPDPKKNITRTALQKEHPQTLKELCKSLERVEKTVKFKISESLYISTRRNDKARCESLYQHLDRLHLDPTFLGLKKPLLCIKRCAGSETNALQRGMCNPTESPRITPLSSKNEINNTQLVLHSVVYRVVLLEIRRNDSRNTNL